MRLFKHAVCGFGIAASLVLAPTAALSAEDVETFQTEDGTELKVESLVSGLNHPWGMAFLPDGRLLVTERNTGQLYILQKDETLSKPVQGVPKVWAQGQGGLMDVVLDPNFAENKFVYLSYAKPGEEGTAATALGRGKFVNDRLQGFEDIFVQQPYIKGPNHFGNRIAFSNDGQFLFLALGERFQFDPAQDLTNHLGKVIRIYPDGRVPEDNPFVSNQNAKPEIWSYGHRNIEAMDVNPETGAVWVVEMGPLGGDELNLIKKAANYGWPVVSWGDNYDGSEIPDPSPNSQFAEATIHWTPVISPSGMDFYEGDMFPNWKGDALVGGLSSQAVVRLTFNNSKASEAERYLLPARIRDVLEAPDGSVYLLTDEDDGQIWRMSKMQ